MFVKGLLVTTRRRDVYSILYCIQRSAGEKLFFIKYLVIVEFEMTYTILIIFILYTS
jgi:hypothetical protein